jgi:O-antigen ligase
MKESLLKKVIFIWLVLMCTMDYLFPLGSLITRLLMWGMNGLLFAIWFTGNISQKRGFTPFRERGIMTVLYLFLFWICISILLSQSPLTGIRAAFPLLVGFLDVYIFYDFLSSSKENMYFFLKVITFFTLFVSCWATIESFYKLSQGESSFKNIYAGFCNQNFLGYFLFLFGPLIVSYYFINSPFHGKYTVWRFLLVFITGYALILSSSRSSWNGFIMAMVFLLSWKSKALGVGILFLAIILNSSIYVLQGGQMYQAAWQATYKDRASAWNVYWDAILKNPFIGMGWGVTPQGALHAHSIYLSDAAQAGVFSIILVVAFYIFFFYGSFQTEKVTGDPRLRAILLGSTATYFGQMFYGLTDLSGILVAFSATSISFLPYLFIAMPLAVRNLCQQDDDDGDNNNESHERDRIISTAVS